MAGGGGGEHVWVCYVSVLPGGTKVLSFFVFAFRAARSGTANRILGYVCRVGGSVAMLLGVVR